jgi:ribosome-associated translation inhibitor RaiA
MKIPLKITMRQMPRSEALEARLRERAAKLDVFHPNITGCQITIEEQRRHHRQGRWFNVRLEVRVPGHGIVVNRDHHEDPYVAARDAFDAATRRLEDIARLHRRDVKTHADELYGRVTRLLVDEGYGFITARDGTEYYFGRDNVVDPSFDVLRTGTNVRFIAEAAAEGMQAKRVTAGRRALAGGA